MSRVLYVGNQPYSEKQVTMLCALAKAPLSVDGINGFDRNCLTKLADLDLVDLSDTRAAITDEGRDVVVKLNAKVNGAGAPTKSRGPSPVPAVGQAKSEPKKTKRQRAFTGGGTHQDSPNQGGGDVAVLEALRGEITSRYEIDLAAVDRLIQIARAIAVGAA